MSEIEETPEEVFAREGYPQKDYEIARLRERNNELERRLAMYEANGGVPVNPHRDYGASYVTQDNLESMLREVDGHVVVPKGRYEVDFDINVLKKGVLEIKSGAEFYFGKKAGITIEGILSAVGTKKEKIRFTSKDGDGWRNLYFKGHFTDDSVMEYCIVSYGRGRKNKYENIGGGGISLESSDMTIKDCVIENNSAEYGGGLYLLKSKPKLDNNTISDNKDMII